MSELAVQEANEVGTPDEGSIVQRLTMRILNSKDVGVDTLREVLKMQNEQEDRVRAREIEDRNYEAALLFSKAFTAAKKVMPQVAKEAYNKQTSSNFAAMESIDLAITPVMTEHGFAITFKSGDSPRDEKHMHIRAILIHEDGHREEYEDQVPIAGVGTKGTRMMTHTHGYGATKTYARRYLKLDIWDVALMDKDSDGNANNVDTTYDTTPWTTKIRAAKTKAAIDTVAAEIKADPNIPKSALIAIRAAWSGQNNHIEANKLKGASNAK